ncbi:MFS general substrate transporter [Whalleya microplaca]|nr:MFS general substrate transporter [Whalleya microplaca]
MTSEARAGKNGGGPIVLIDEEEDRWDGRTETDEPTETSPLVNAGVRHDGTSISNNERRENWLGYEDFVDFPWWQRPSVYWLLGPYLLFTLAFGGIIVPKLNLIVDLVCRSYFADRQVLDPAFTFTPVIMGADNPQCNIPAVQKNVATFTLVLSALAGGLSAITAPKLGSLSDRYGRKRLLVIASCGGVLNEIVTIFVAKFPETIDFHWLILGSFFDGIAGSFTAGGVLAHSYTSDCTPPSKRGVHIGYLHACLFTGLALGPLLTGYFVEWTGSLLSIFYVVLGCHLAVILFFWSFLPESLSHKRQMAAREKHRYEQEATAAQLRSGLPGSVSDSVRPQVASFLSDRMGSWLPAFLSANPLAPLKILVPSGRHNKLLRRNLVVLALIDAIILAAAMGSGTVIILYSEYMFNWRNLEASRFVSVVSLTRVVILLGILPIINYFFRILPLRRKRREDGNQNVLESNSGADNTDVWVLRIALLCDAAGTVGYIFVRRQELFILCGITTAFGGLASATVGSAITKHVPGERVGSLLGATGLLHALGRVFAPTLFNGLYAGTVETFPQAFFVLLASLFGLAVCGSFLVRPHVYLEEDGYVAVPVRESPRSQDADILADDEMPSETLPRI